MVGGMLRDARDTMGAEIPFDKCLRIMQRLFGFITVCSCVSLSLFGNSSNCFFFLHINQSLSDFTIFLLLGYCGNQAWHMKRHGFDSVHESLTFR